MTDWLKASIKTSEIGVDRDNRRILGMVMAQEGVFQESDPRGRFDGRSLKKIVTLARKQPGGLKSRFSHPTLSDDGLGSFLGRAKNVRMDSVTVERDGDIVSLLAVRGDLHLADASFDSPRGNLGQYVLDLAEEDSDAISSSLVLQADEEFEMDAKGKPVRDADTGDVLPPYWRPTRLHAIDVVDEGAAVDGLLSAVGVTGLRDDLVRQGYTLLSGFMPGRPRSEVEPKLSGWLKRALDLRYGRQEDIDVVYADTLSRRLKLRGRQPLDVE